MSGSEYLKKLDPRSRRSLATGSLQGSVEALLRTERPITSSQEEELREAGWTCFSTIGNVASGKILDAEHVKVVAELPFVRQVELSQPLFEEADEI